jgi:hypothetical protein
MPNYTAADSKKHYKGLSSKKQRQWAKVANSAYDRCTREGRKNCDAEAIRVANGVVESHREEDIDALFTILGNSPQLREEVVTGWYHRYCGEPVSEVVETAVIEGVEVGFLDTESYMWQISEHVMFDAEEVEEGNSPVVEEVKDNRHLATFRALQGRNEQIAESGISKNRNFYSGEVAEALAPLLRQRRKMYLDHRLTDQFGRSTMELAGIINEAWAEKGASFVKTDVLTENPQTGWIWEVMKKYPNEIGVSINALVKGRRAKVDKQEVFAVEGWSRVLSLDYVGEPSAGGTFMAMESDVEEAQGQGTGKEKAGGTDICVCPKCGYKMAHERNVPCNQAKCPKCGTVMTGEGTPGSKVSEGEVMDVMEIAEATKKLADLLEKSKRKHALSMAGWLIVDLIRSAASDKNVDDAARRKNVKDLLAEFRDEIEKLDPVGLYNEMRDDRDYYLYATALEAVEIGVEFDLIVLESEDGHDLVEANLDDSVDLGTAIVKSAVSEVKFSDKDWSKVDKSKLPASAFLVVGDKEKKGTWHLPYKDESGAVNRGALRAIAGVLGGARAKRTFKLPKEVRDKIVHLLKSAGISSKFTKSPTKKEAAAVDVEELKNLSLEQILVVNPAVQAEKRRLDQAVSEATTAQENTQKKLEAKEVELAEAKKKLDEMELSESERTRVDLVNRLLDESAVLDPKIEGHITKGFKSSLIKTAAEGEEAVKQAISDRESLIKAERQRQKPVAEGVGPRPNPDPPAAENNGNGGPYANTTVIESQTLDALVANLRAR